MDDRQFPKPAMNELLTPDLVALGTRIGAALKARGETIAVAESSAGGLVSAALLAMPGASAFYLGGAVVYTAAARNALLQLPANAFKGMRSSSEPYALFVAQTVRDRFGATWAITETGAAGPTGNRYGDAAGHSCFAVAGPVERSVTLETGSNDRVANMQSFAAGALNALLQALDQAPLSARP